MNDIFKGILRKFYFFDDILVYMSHWHDHLNHLDIVPNILKQQHLYANLSKCSFGVKEIDYLGHIISGTEVVMEMSKIEAVKNLPQPVFIKQLWGFLGLTGYYRRFIKSYAQIATPLTVLLKKDSFKWSSVANESFVALKQAMVSTPILVIPNFFEPFILETDASSTGVGVVLSQNNHPIAYFSKKLSFRMQHQ